MKYLVKEVLQPLIYRGTVTLTAYLVGVGIVSTQAEQIAAGLAAALFVALDFATTKAK